MNRSTPLAGSDGARRAARKLNESLWLLTSFCFFSLFQGSPGTFRFLWLNSRNCSPSTAVPTNCCCARPHLPFSSSHRIPGMTNLLARTSPRISPAASGCKIWHTGEDREVRIFMNNPLRYGGESVYQASFDPDDHGSVSGGPQSELAHAVFRLRASRPGLLIHFLSHLIPFLKARPPPRTTPPPQRVDGPWQRDRPANSALPEEEPERRAAFMKSGFRSFWSS